MDQNQPELTFEESLKQVMQTLPPVIRDYLTKGKYTPIARSMMAKYNLRIDQGGVLEREIMLLLMGIENPTEFTTALAEEAKLTKIVIDGIVQDVNDQIFVPLRKEEEKGGTIESQKTVPEPATHFKLENKIPVSRPATPAPMPKKDWSPPVGGLPPAPMKGILPPKVFLPRPSTLGDVVRSVLAAPKPVDTGKLLEDHEEPHIAFEAKSPEVRPRGISVRPVVAPENLPGAMPEQVIPEVPIPEVRPSPLLKVEPQMPKPVPVAPIEPKPIPAPITSYSSDPYREPVDEPPTE